MRKSVKILILALVAFVCVAPAWSASAKVTYVKGKVEVNRKGSWVAVKVGDLIAESETISTGYQSEARLNLNGSVLAVAALTRVKVEALKTGDSQDTVSVYVDTGATRSKVTHTNNKKVDYTTRTAVAVASGRGTIYGQTAAGFTWCDDGAVAVYSADEYASNVSETRVVTARGSATANTPANEISDNAPANAFVIAQGQSTSFNDEGKPSAPESNQRRTQNRISNSMLTAAQTDALQTYENVVVNDNIGAKANANIIFNVKVIE